MNIVVDDSSLNTGDIELLPDSVSVEDYIEKNINATAHGIEFTELTLEKLNYVVYFNATLNLMRVSFPRRFPDGRNELQLLINTAYTKILSGQQFEVEIEKQDYPKSGFPFTTGVSAVDQLGRTFYFSSLMLNYVIILYYICREKEQKIRQGLKMAGLSDFVYWTSWFTSMFILSTISNVVMILTGIAYRINFFIFCDFTVHLVLLSLFSIAIIIFSFLTSTFITRSKSSRSTI